MKYLFILKFVKKNNKKKEKKGESDNLFIYFLESSFHGST